MKRTFALSAFFAVATLLPNGLPALAPRPALAATTVSPTKPVAVAIARGGVALLPIVVSDKASARVRAAAEALATYLGRISGGQFAVVTAPQPFGTGGAPMSGLTVGVAADFVGQSALLGAADSTHNEDYRLWSTAKGLWLVGTTDLAAEHAVWDLLYRIGYRQFFPGPKWEVVPHHKDISLAIDVREHPDFLTRRIWYGFGSFSENLDLFYGQWWGRNRVTVEGFDLQNSHEYTNIILRHKAEFDAHPEYYAEIGGKRTVWNGSQFCISNPGLRKLVVDDALQKFAQNPNLQSVSVEPNDGDGMCECPQCKALGSPSDRVVILANEVARAVNAKYPNKYVGLLAYNQHAAPPTIEVDPHVVVCIATSFIKGGFTLDQLIDGWSRKAKVFGIYDYYSFFTWDWDMPGNAKAGNIDYLKTSTVDFYKHGARFFAAESSDNWGPNGLGYYIASRLLWDTTQAQHVDELRNDFLDKCFGPARAPMAQWYALIDASSKTVLSTDKVGRMYRLLGDALKLTDDEAIRARIHDLALYVHWVDLANSAPRLENASQVMMRYSWRIRFTNMMHTLGHWSITQDKVSPDATKLAEPDNPWKSSEPFTPQEIDKLITDGIAANPIVDFKTTTYSRDLVPAAPLNLTTPQAAGYGYPGSFGFIRGKASAYTYVAQLPGAIAFRAMSGISSGQAAGTAAVTLSATAPGKAPAVAAAATLPRDNATTSDVRLEARQTGLQTLDIDDGTAGTRLNWPLGTPFTIEMSHDRQHDINGAATLYFYVPKGTKAVAGYQKNLPGELLAPDGSSRLTFANDNVGAYWSVPVKVGEDGKLWEMSGISGSGLQLLTVPPLLARSANELLLPREVVAADSR